MTDDLPLPDGPTIASSGAPTSRATSSATSRSRPKKYSASSASNVARPLYGHTGVVTSRSPVAGGESRALAGGLQVDDAAGQLGLERARLAAAGGRPAGDGVDAPRGLTARPLARRLVDAARDPAAGREQLVDRDRAVVAGGRVEGGDRPHAFGVERIEHDRLLRLEPCQRSRLQPGREHEDGSAAERRRERRSATRTSVCARSASSTTTRAERASRARARAPPARPRARPSRLRRPPTRRRDGPRRRAPPRAGSSPRRTRRRA